MSKKPKNENYGTTTALLKGTNIRILDIETNDNVKTWRLPKNEEELIYYNQLIQATILVHNILPFRIKSKKIKLFGIHSSELEKNTGVEIEKFKIYNFISEDKIAVEGHVCKTYTKAEIVEFLWRAGYNDFDDKEFGNIPPITKVSLDTMIKELKMGNPSEDHGSEDEDLEGSDSPGRAKIEFFYKMMKSKKYDLTIGSLCDRLDNFLKHKGLILNL